MGNIIVTQVGMLSACGNTEKEGHVKGGEETYFPFIHAFSVFQL